MGLSRFLDANVLIRYLQGDTRHDKYTLALQELSCGGVICDSVFAEIVYAWRRHYRIHLAETCAIRSGELELFQQNPVEYLRALVPPSGWKQEAYKALNTAMQQLFVEFPAVTIENSAVHQVAIALLQKTGFDWVDCWLVAREHIEHVEVVSLDEHIAKARDALHPSECAGAEEQVVPVVEVVEAAAVPPSAESTVEVLGTQPSEESVVSGQGVGDSNRPSGVSKMNLFGSE